MIDYIDKVFLKRNPDGTYDGEIRTKDKEKSYSIGHSEYRTTGETTLNIKDLIIDSFELCGHDKPTRYSSVNVKFAFDDKE